MNKPLADAIEHARQMGYDAGFNMPNTVNCHFSLFATRELMKAWEQGKREGDAKREAAASPINALPEGEQG